MEKDDNIQEELERNPQAEEKVYIPLEEGEPGDEGYHFPWSILIVSGVLLIGIIVCVVVIMLNGGF